MSDPSLNIAKIIKRFPGAGTEVLDRVKSRKEITHPFILKEIIKTSVFLLMRIVSYMELTCYTNDRKASSVKNANLMVKEIRIKSMLQQCYDIDLHQS